MSNECKKWHSVLSCRMMINNGGRAEIFLAGIPHTYNDASVHLNRYKQSGDVSTVKVYRMLYVADGVYIPFTGTTVHH